MSEPNTIPAVYYQKANEVVAAVGLPPVNWIGIIITILQQLFGGGNGGLGSCFPPTGGGTGTPAPAPKPVIQAVLSPNGYHLLGLRGIVNHHVAQRGLRRPIAEAIRQSGSTSTDDEITTMYNYANGVGTGTGTPVIQTK